MLQNMFVTVPILTLLAGLFSNSLMLAQISPEQLDALGQTLAHADMVFQKLSPQQRRTLSGGAQNLMRLSEEWPNIEPQLLQMSQRPATQAPPTALAPLTVGSAGSAVPVSNPSTDFINSIKGGFTQSETSTAWCGGNVVVGYNDSGSLLESLLGFGGTSLEGVSLSTDGGASFQDLGYLNPGPVGGTLVGDPVVRCTDPSTFYYSSIFFTFNFPTSISAVSVSKSVNGGLSFGNPVPAASKSGGHLLDKPWMAIDSTNPNRIYVSYTDFDSSGTSPLVCPPFPNRVAIEIVQSTDGGNTWSAPVVIAEVCRSPSSFVQGSQIAVGPGGEVYTAYEAFATSSSGTSVREIRVRKSSDHGQSFAPFAKVADVTFVGDGNNMQGGFRNVFALGNIAVDQSGTASNGNVYIDWQDGRFGKSSDFFGGYNYADVLMSRSTDGGATWSAPVRVNDNSKTPGARGTDQYQPSLAVDKTGKLGACWYDRREDFLNYLVGRFCGESTDAGRTWTNLSVDAPSWEPINGLDQIFATTYMGDYDGLATDATNATPGFIGAFQVTSPSGGTVYVPNQDVMAVSFQ